MPMSQTIDLFVKFDAATKGDAVHLPTAKKKKINGPSSLFWIETACFDPVRCTTDWRVITRLPDEPRAPIATEPAIFRKTDLVVAPIRAESP